MSTFTPEQERTISTLTEVSSWATLAGSLFVVASYLAFKEIRHFHLRLIFFLAIADFFTSIVFILNKRLDISQVVTCQALGAGLQFFGMASMLWAFCIALVLDQVIRVNNYHIETNEKYFHLLSWGVPAVLVAISQFQGLFVSTGLWCWLSGTERGMYRWLFFYGPLVFILCYVVAIYTLVSRKIRQQMHLSQYQGSSETTIQQTFRWFIIGWIICWVPALADRVQGVIQPTHPIFLLQCSQAFFAPLAGFCNSVAMGFNDEIQAQYVALFWRFGVRFKKIKSPTTIQTQETKLIQEILREYDVQDG